MNKRRIVKGLLFTVFAACFCLGSSFFAIQKKTERLPTQTVNAQAEQAYHTVTFMLDGEIYALLEYVPHNTALEDAMIEDVQLEGYDFIGWTYGEGEWLTADTPILADMTVTAVLRLNAYLIGGNYYETLDEACAQAGDEEIVIHADVDVVTLTQGTSLLNLNGNTVGDILVEGGTLILYGGEVTGNITVSGGTLQIKGGSFLHDVSGYVPDGYHCVKAEEIYLVSAHESQSVEGYAPTCVESGLTDGEVCHVCGETLVLQTAIPPLGHQTQALEKIPATCEEVGYTAGEKCLREGCAYVSGREVIPATGHTESIDEGIPSTCQSQGKTQGSHCSACGKILTPQEGIPEVPHSYQQGKCIYCGEDEEKEEDSESAFSQGATVSNNPESGSSNNQEESAEKGCTGFVELSFGGVALGFLAALCSRKKRERK